MGFRYLSCVGGKFYYFLKFKLKLSLLNKVCILSHIFLLDYKKIEEIFLC